MKRIKSGDAALIFFSFCCFIFVFVTFGVMVYHNPAVLLPIGIAFSFISAPFIFTAIWNKIADRKTRKRVLAEMERTKYMKWNK